MGKKEEEVGNQNPDYKKAEYDPEIFIQVIIILRQSLLILINYQSPDTRVSSRPCMFK